MSKSNGKAAVIARAYVEAMVSKDVEAIMSLSADEVVCISPLGTITGVGRFREFHEGFARMILKLTTVASYGDDDQAVVVYDVQTHPVPHATVAEYIKVESGKLVSTQVIYDATPFAAYAASVQRH